MAVAQAHLCRGMVLLLEEVAAEPQQEITDVVLKRNAVLQRQFESKKGLKGGVPSVRIGDSFSDMEFKSHFPMERSTVEDLVKLVGPHLNTRIISIERKILATLWLLGNQESFRIVGDRFGLNKSSLHTVLYEVCGVLNALKGNLIKWPSKEELPQLVAGFTQQTGFPGVVGVVDCTRIKICPPAEHKEIYMNQDDFPSIQLQAVCDADFRFFDVYCGWPGCVSDAEVFRSSPLREVLENGYFPQEYHLLGDSTYTLAPYLMVPYRDNGHLGEFQTAFNIQHASTKVAIERALGLLKWKFKRLRHLDMRLRAKLPLIVAAACGLHNFTLAREKLDLDMVQLPEDNTDTEDEDMEATAEICMPGGHAKRDGLAALLA